MHELSIALNIVNIAEETAAKNHVSQIQKIDLHIGKLAGIEIDALNFVWPAAVKDTVLENAVKSIKRIEGKGQCNICNHSFPMEAFYDSCPQCSSYNIDIIQGKELRIHSLTAK